MYYILYGILYLVSLLPFFVLYLISDFACFILYNVVGYRREVVMNNLSIAFPEKSPGERKKIARRFYRNLTDSFIETIKLLSISERSFRRRASMDLSKVIALAGTGKNIQFHCGHQFGWEYGNWIVAKKMPIPFIGIYMRINNKAVDRLFYNLRAKSGTVLVAAQEFRSRMHQLFDQQYCIGLAADQNPGIPQQAYWCNFFGRPAPFATGPHKSAARNNAAIVFVKLVKEKRGVYAFIPVKIIANVDGYTPEDLALQYRDFIEETVRENPDNYLWSHRRWKWAFNETFVPNWIDNAPVPEIKK